MSDVFHTDILIVGGGPVGLGLALILARFNVNSLVLETRTEPTSLNESRAIVWMPRLLEWLEWLGIKEDFEAAGIHRYYHEFWGATQKLLTLDFTRADSIYQYTLNLPQHAAETLLEKHLLESGYSELLRNHKAIQINQNKDYVEAVAETPDGLKTFRARYGIGCDGAKSLVRESLKIKLKWNDYRTDSAVADFEMDIEQDPQVSILYLNAARPYGYFCFNPGKWRFIYRLNNGEDRAALTTEKAATELMLQKTPRANIKNFLWASAFRLGQGQSESYRHKRWLLCGDAAHAMGPSAGAGMMLGLMGAWRLGWRLAYLCRGDFNNEGLLDDYTREQIFGAGEIQNSNHLIFWNMSLSNTLAAIIRNTGLAIAGKFQFVGERMVNEDAILLQKLPVNEAVDTITNQELKSVERYDQWELGKRIPIDGLRNAKFQLDKFKARHSTISLGRKPSSLRLVREIISNGNFPNNYLGHFSAEENLDRTTIVLIRPDQQISFIGQVKV